MSENELLEAFRKSRSEEAFAGLVKSHAGLVYSVARRRSADAALAEDITQMVFIRLARNFPKVRTQAELAAWLHRTTINVTIDNWRSENRRRKREQEAVIMEPAAAENEIWEEISPQLDEALNQLGEEDRQALLLRFFGKKPMREVGAALGVSEDAAKMRIARAVDRLRTRLGVRGAVCTSAVLGMILAERAAEAAPGKLVAQLTAIKLPVAGTNGIVNALSQASKVKLAAGAIAGALMITGIVHQIRSGQARVPQLELAGAQTNAAATKIIANARRKLGDPGTLNAAQAGTTRLVKTMFHVLDSQTGRGVANAKVHTIYFGTGGESEVADTLTDERGDATISEPNDPARGKGMNVFVVAENHVPEAVSFKSDSPKEYSLKLDPALTVSGIVVDEQGRPLAAVDISARTPQLKPGRQNVDLNTRLKAHIGDATYTFSALILPPNPSIVLEVCHVTSSDDGSWSFSYVPSDLEGVGFVLKKSGYMTTDAPVPLAKTGLKNLVLVMDRGFTVTGRLIDRTGQPVAAARVRTLNNDDRGRKATKSDANGFFAIAGVAGEPAENAPFPSPELRTNENGQFVIASPISRGPMHVQLSVQAKGFASQAKGVDLSEGTNIVNFTLLPGNIFRGIVVDEADNPIANAIVRTDFDFKNQIGAQFDWSAHTDARGRFEWDSAPAEVIFYWIEADGCEPIQSTSFEANGSDQRIVLKKSDGR